MNRPASPTASGSIVLVGVADARTLVQVTGGARTATATADRNGNFSVAVDLNLNADNYLVVTSINGEGNPSPPAEVQVRHDNIPPVVAIGSPGGGTSTESVTVSVTGTASDGYLLASVRVNGVVAAQSGASYSAVATLTIGANLIRAEATDAAGNSAFVEISVHHYPRVSAEIGAQGGHLAATSGPTLGASISVPPGAFSQPTRIVISAPLPETLPPFDDGIAALGPPISYETVGLFAEPLTITVPFDPSLVAPARGDARSIELFTLDPILSRWVLVPDAAQTGNTMTATVPHFTIYQVGMLLPDVKVDTLAGNGGTGPVNLALDARATPLPFPEWTAVNEAGAMFVSSYDGTNTRVFEIQGSKLKLIGVWI